jgi:DNA-binding MarR family transcriptional regulator
MARAAEQSLTDSPHEPADHEPTPDEVPITALLRAARGSYGHAIRTRLAAAGYDDLPRNGPFVLGGIVNRGGTAGRLVRELGVSKQAASQLIDTLVLRGYLQREPDPEDRRRVTIVVTERGRAAAAAVLSGVEAVDAELAERIAPVQLAGMRAGLVALCEIRERLEDESHAAAHAS